MSSCSRSLKIVMLNYLQLSLECCGWRHDFQLDELVPFYQLGHCKLLINSITRHWVVGPKVLKRAEHHYLYNYSLHLLILAFYVLLITAKRRTIT